MDMAHGSAVFRGTFAHSTASEALQINTHSVLGVRNGKILFLEPEEKLQRLQLEHALHDAPVVHLEGRQFMMPGFVDTHAHAPQFLFTGTGMDRGLLDWLNTYTYPAEAKFKDKDFALDPYTKVVSRTLNAGTTAICYYATIHNEASFVLCDVIERLGQRAFVGKVNVDMGAPDYYLETTEDSTHDTELFIKNVLARKNSLLTPVVTPRFAAACSETLMSNLASLAKKYDLPIQTHLSETCGECQMVQQLYPQARDYVDIYDKAGLLGNKTILGHGIYLSKEERETIKDRRSGISHCPNSNVTIRSGFCDVRRLLNEGVKVGLGTDFGAGSSVTMLDAIRMCTQVSNVLSVLHQHDENQNSPPYRQLDHREAFRLATLGSSQVMGLEDKIGNLEPGKDFDAILVDPDASNSPMTVFDWESTDEVIQKFFFTGDDRNIVQVYVAGRQVKGDQLTDG